MKFMDDVKDHFRVALAMAQAKADEMKANDEARMGGSSLLGVIAALSIGAYLLAYLFLPGIQALASGNTTGLSTAQIALVGLIIIVIIIAVVVIVLREAGVKI